MRRIPALLAILLLGAPLAAAQTFEAIGARAGITFASIDVIEPRYEGRTGFVAAGHVAFRLTDQLLLNVELEYALRGYDYVVPTPPPEADHMATTSLHFFSVPLSVRIGVPATDQLDIYIASGPRIDYLFNRDLGSEQDFLGQEIEERVGGGVHFGGGLSLRDVVGSALGLELRYVLGMSDLAPNHFAQSVTMRGIDVTLSISF